MYFFFMGQLVLNCSTIGATHQERAVGDERKRRHTKLTGSTQEADSKSLEFFPIMGRTLKEKTQKVIINWGEDHFGKALDTKHIFFTQATRAKTH
jgi:hypothetical protein